MNQLEIIVVEKYRLNMILARYLELLIAGHSHRDTIRDNYQGGNGDNNQDLWQHCHSSQTEVWTLAGLPGLRWRNTGEGQVRMSGGRCKLAQWIRRQSTLTLVIGIRGNQRHGYTKWLNVRHNGDTFKPRC